MDTIVKKIVKMLADDRVERRCAAAMVLGELRLKDPEIIEALGGCLDEENQLLVLYAVEALAGVRSSKITPYVMPLLDHPNDEIQVQAAALLASQGNQAANTLARELHGAPIARRRMIVNILARNHDVANYERLIKLLPDNEIGEYIQVTLRNEIEHMTPKEAEILRTYVADLIKSKEWLVDTVATARALRLLGYMRDGKLVRTLLPFAAEKKPVPIRLAALAALRRPISVARSTEEPVKVLLGYTDDPDATLARAAIDTLQGLKIPQDATQQLMKLSESRHAETRKFALEALSRSDSQKVVRSLIGHLMSGDPSSREAAARSLSQIEKAPRAIVKELQNCEDPKLIQVLCDLLKNHADTLKPAARKVITELTVTALEKDLPTAEPLLDLLTQVEEGKCASVLISRAMTHKRAKRHEQAFTLLNKLDDVGLLDDDSRYAAVISGLCSLPTKKELGRANRTTNPILRHVVKLIEIGYPIDAKLPREKSLQPEDMFYVGFNFS